MKELYNSLVQNTTPCQKLSFVHWNVQKFSYWHALNQVQSLNHLGLILSSLKSSATISFLDWMSSGKEMLLVYWVLEYKYQDFNFLLGIFTSRKFYFQKHNIRYISLQVGALYCWTHATGFTCLVTLNKSDKNPFNWISVLMWERFEQQSILSLMPFFFFFFAFSQKFSVASLFFLHLSRLNRHSWNSAIPVNH